MGIIANKNKIAERLFHAKTPEDVESALKAGANVNARDKNDLTPLMYAAEKGYTEVARLLLEHGANVNARDKNGLTPLIYAVKDGQTMVASLLIEKGADVDAREWKDGRTPLIFAAEKGYTDIAKLLIKNGADIFARDWEMGWTPLAWSHYHGYEPTMCKILEKAEQIRSKIAEYQKRFGNKKISGTVIADKIAEKQISGQEKRVITPQVGKELRQAIIKELQNRKSQEK